ncbi:hypothetical protein ID866_13234 [Astraeus odoratus]|nr:hypothetical protein ID866_13234 [Astraeus odoratus]
MSSPCHTLSPHKILLVKTKDLCKSEVGGCRASSKEAEKKVWEEAKRKAEEECKVQEAAARAKEEAERMARETTERREREAMEEWADAEQRALKERLWELVVAPLQVAKPSGRMSMARPSTTGQRCCNKGTLCVLSAAKGKTMVCEACHHMKASCSWMKKTTGEVWRRKWVWHLEEMEDMEMMEASEDDEEEEMWSHFAVLSHLMEEH